MTPSSSIVVERPLLPPWWRIIRAASSPQTEIEVQGRGGGNSIREGGGRYYFFACLISNFFHLPHFPFCTGVVENA